MIWAGRTITVRWVTTTSSTDLVKTGELNKFKRRMRMHNTDSLGWNALNRILYKMIPFYIDFDSEMDIASGLYYNNSNDSTFDMDSEHSNYWHRYSYLNVTVAT